MQQTSFSQRDCARLLNSLKLFRLSKSKGGKKALSARELNSCTNLLLPRFPWAVCQREVLVHIFNGEGGRKKEISLSFHNLPNAVSSLLASEVLSFQTYMIMSRIIFLGFAIFQGRKLILSSRNEASGHLAISVLLPASYRNQKKKMFPRYHTFHYLFLSCWLNFSHCLFLFNEKSFTPEAIFPQKTASIVTIFHIFSFHPHLLRNICIDRWRWDSRVLPGLWIQSWLSGHAISARNWPGTIQAQPSPRSLHCCCKAVPEQHHSGGWKTSSNFLAMFSSDQFIAICSCASSAFCFNSSFPSFVFTSLLYL